MTATEASARTALRRYVDEPPMYLNSLGVPVQYNGGLQITRDECLALLDMLERWRLALERLATHTWSKSETENRRVQGVASEALRPKAVGDV